MADSVATTEAGENRRRGFQHWIERRCGLLARRDPTRLIHDVFYNPSIGPVAAWLIGGLIALVAWLTVHYAPGAVARADAPDGSDGAGIIPVGTGYGTLAAVAALTLIAGMQPVLEKRFTSDWADPLSGWFARQSLALRAPVVLVGLVFNLLFCLPAWASSLLDYLLARPIAILAGAKWSPFWLRYGVFLFWMTISIAASWAAPAPLGLYAFAFGVALVIGIVRRWNWVERDREAFFVSRKQDPESERVGFAEDLRDEALVAIIFLFVLIPLGLRQIDLAYPDTFSINGADGDSASVLAWLGFFGAELAKSVPFVDWSEVFHVANGSPIEPNTVLGAQVVFAMRATLDLLMIAAVVQAVQLASRLAEQEAAFAAGKIDILEPFVERVRLHALGAALDRADAGKVVEVPRVASFPLYSPERLTQIVLGGGDASQRAVQALADPAARRAALALATAQAVGMRRVEEARPLIIHAALRDPEEANRRLALRIAQESEPTALMAAAYVRARSAQSEGGACDPEALLPDFQEAARPFALRAILSARGELDQMVPIPAGKFTMGAPEGEKGSGDKERPQHEVTIATPFEIGKYPVTFEEYDVFSEATGHYRPPDDKWGRARRPVIYVNWQDAHAYIAWLNSWTGERFRLPSEAEWEYACRAGTTTRFFFGDDESQLADYAWFEANADKQTHPVGEKRPNGFGLYDTHSNVREWCEDVWHGTYDGAPSDGSAWVSGGDNWSRVLRGSSWNSQLQFLGSARRIGFDLADRVYMGLGFRLARTISPS